MTVIHNFTTRKVFDHLPHGEGSGEEIFFMSLENDDCFTNFLYAGVYHVIEYLLSFSSCQNFNLHTNAF